MCGAIHHSFPGIETIPHFEIVEVERGFLAAGEDGYSARVGRFEEEGEEVVDEAETGVVAEGVGDVYSFDGF